MVGVTDEYRLCRITACSNDLTDETVGIDDGLAVVHAVLFATADNDVVSIGISVNGENLDDPHFVANKVASFEHVSEAIVLSFERCQSLQAGIG